LASFASKLPPTAQNAVRGVERALTPRQFRRIHGVTPPPWLDTTGDPVSMRSKDQPSHVAFTVQEPGRERTDHRMVVAEDEADPQTLVLSPPDPFERVDFSLVETEHADRAVVTAEFETLDGSTHTETRRILSGFHSTANYVPVSVSVPEPAEEVTLTVESETTVDTVRERLFRLYHREGWHESETPRLSVPAPRATGGTPILFISVDTFRYDYLHTFDAVLDELGDLAVVPDEPRTQGYVTNSSHASTFTGEHPMVHGYFGKKGSGIAGGINEDLETIPELLARNQYKCSGCGSQGKIGPEKGFGDGMHRFRHYPISWLSREYDATDVTDATVEWIRKDAAGSSNRLFYFVHFFDAHYPYFPPQPSGVETDLDFAAVDEFIDEHGPADYLERLHGPDPEMDPDTLELFERNYEESLRFVASQVVRILQALKRADLFEDAFIVVAGDHGEEFLERKFGSHQTLYDANIRPGMIVKPPRDDPIPVPDTVDLIDVFPTIARLVGEDPPNNGTGQPFQDWSERPRITERVGLDWYNVAVEVDGVKGIFTYDYDFPPSPANVHLESGPVETELYRLSAVRAGNFQQADVSEDTRTRLREIAESFAGDRGEYDHDMSGSVPDDVETRLEHLGYR